MPGLHLHTSNNIEYLLEDLSQKILQNPLPPLIKETIIIQSRGMEKWISLKLSKKFGIWANAEYPFPNKAVETIFKSVIPDMTDERLFDTETVLFAIMRILPEIYSAAEFSEIKDYISNGNSDIKTYQISGIISDLFDQYITFRPDMISQWDSGEDKSWQAILWRRLRSEFDHKMPHENRKYFFENIGSIEKSKLPQRLFIFGVSYMPNFHIDIIRAAAQYIDIHFYILNPCRKFWFDIKSKKEINRLTGKTGKTENELHIEEGNRLLASWGKSGKEFLGYLYNLDPDENEDSLFKDYDSSTMLGKIKTAILDLSEPEIFSINEKEIHSDKSIRLHCCHSQMREIEILYDNILDVFSRYNDLKPEHILVMAPDIEKYSRFIHAFFSEGKIPYAISDRSFLSQNREVEILLKIINIYTSRFESDRVLEILEFDEIRNKFSIKTEDIEIIKKWITETNTAWGLDKEHKKKLGLPEYNENTWDMFKKRILLGYALPRGNGNFFNGILPYDEAEGKDSFVIGNFLDYMDILEKYYHLLSEKKSLKVWAELFENLISDFMQEDISIDFIQFLKENLNILTDIQYKSGFDTPVEISIVRDFLSGKLKNQRISANYLNGSVTFCEMLPMRSIPFKIIFIIGMNDDSFPRSIKPVSFDLIKEKPVPGDRNIRDEDRYLFLETLISAERELHISYVGQNIYDNSILPPSVMVSELLDYIDTFFKIENETAISGLIQIRHKLHGFSREYFTGDQELFSFSKENYSISQNLKTKKEDKSPFYKTFETHESFSGNITNQLLINFFKDPAKFFTAKILGINLDMFESGIEANEKFTLDNLDLYKIGSRAYAAYLNKKESSLFMELKAEGSIPHGKFGEILVNKTVSDFIESVNEIGIESSAISINSSVIIDDTEIFFQIDNVFKEGILNIKNSSLNAQFLITAWINHLLCNSVQKNKSLIAAKDERKLTLWSLKEIDSDEAVLHLKKIISIFKKGCRNPFLFMPGLSFNIVLEKASKKIKLKEDSDLRYFNLIFGESDIIKSDIDLNEELKKNSICVCFPILNFIEEEKVLQ